MQRNWNWALPQSFFAKHNGAPEAVAETCRAAGIGGLEPFWSALEGWSERRYDEVGAIYRGAGIALETFHLPFGVEHDLASFYESARRAAVDSVSAWMERSVRLGSRIGILHPGGSYHPVEVEGVDPYLRAFDRSITTLLERAAALDYTLAVENLPPRDGVARFGSRPKHLARIAAEFQHPNLGFCFDTGHALMTGRDAIHGYFTAMGSRLVAFHLSDSPGDRDLHLAPGHGNVDWPRVFRHMGDLGFSGYACIETPPFAAGPDYQTDAWRAMIEETDALVAAA